MVNNPDPRIVLPDAFVTQQGAKDRIKIRNGPIYDLSIVKQLVVQHGLVIETAKARRDISSDFDPPLSTDDIQAIILALRHDHFDSSEICATFGNAKVNSDGYCIRWKLNTNREDTTGHFGRKIFIKFGFNYPTDSKCLIVSIHNSSR